MASNLQKPNEQFVCSYCGKEYTRARAFEVHMCTKKQRALQRDEKRVRYGFYAYNRFNRLSCGQKKEASYEEFCNSQYYNAFVKFGSYISNVKPLYPDRYIDYVVTSGIRLKNWCDDHIYEKYVIDLVKKEPVEVGLERSINTMIEWSTDNNSVWNHYFDYVSSDKALWDIKDGKISPWLVLNTYKGKVMLSNFDNTQLDIVYSIINPDFWSKKFKSNPNDVETVLLLAKEFNL